MQRGLGKAVKKDWPRGASKPFVTSLFLFYFRSIYLNDYDAIGRRSSMREARASASSQLPIRTAVLGMRRTM